MVNIVANFLLALVATLVVSGLAKWVAGRIASANARVAAFSVGCGYVIGKYSFVKPLGASIADNIAALAGAIVALALLWIVFFSGRNRARAD